MSDVNDPRYIDPEFEAARAKRELRRLLRPYVQDHVGDQLAEQFVGWELDEGWRAPARALPFRTDRRADPDTTHRGAELARQALAARRGDTSETHQENDQP